MEHIFELVAEMLFGCAKKNPDKMPEDITYKSNFIVKHPTKNNIARILATLIIMIVFSVLWIITKDDIRFLFVGLIILAFALFALSLIAFSFRCFVTESFLERSYWGLNKKHILWSDVKCISVIEKTDEKSVIIAIYKVDGKCVLDLNTDMENAWYVIKMAEQKNITIKHEKDLSLKQISHLDKSE